VTIPPLTWLYVPADRPDRVPKAFGSGAHAVIVDLEDAVAPDAKVAARAGLAGLLHERSPVPVFVRLNAMGSRWWADDLTAVASLPIAGVILTKVESPDDVPELGELAVNCLIETPVGVERAFEIALHPSVRGISLGEADLQARTGAHGAGLDWARSRIVNAACAAGLPRPPQSVYPDVADVDGLAVSSAHGRELGFFGRAAIHPRQLHAIEQAYLPTADAVAAAREIVAAAAGHGEGGFALDGRFVDAPIVAAAEQTVTAAARYGTRE
jgi:citrate lyase subunit beta/citryl-CoA lyase